MDAILTPPDSVDEGVWKYEHLRQFCMQLNFLAVALQVRHFSSVYRYYMKFDMELQDECEPDKCTQMTATEQWIFLCAAHKNPKEVRTGSERIS